MGGFPSNLNDSGRLSGAFLGKKGSAQLLGGAAVSKDFYCDEVLRGRTTVEKVLETENVLAFHHTRPFYPVHVVVIPKKHIYPVLGFLSRSGQCCSPGTAEGREKGCRSSYVRTWGMWAPLR